MAKQTINIGTVANDGTGTPNRDAWDMVNDNFTELYDGKQAIDSDLTAIAALTPSNDDIIQRKAGAWANRTVAQVATDLQTPFDSRYQALDADLTAIAGLSATNDDFVQRKAGAWTNRTVAQVQADLGIDSTTTRTYYAIDNGITTGGSGAANTAALQTLVNTVSAAGGGVIQFDYGTYNLNYTAASPWAAYASTNRYAVQLKSGVYLRGMGSVSGTVLKLANTQMSGTTNGVHLFTAGDNCTGFGFIDLEIDGNAAGQTGWSGGYGQSAGDKSCALATEWIGTNDVNLTGLLIDNVYAHGFFGASFDIAHLNNGIVKFLRVDDNGEGLAFNRSTNVDVSFYDYRNTNTVSVGDGFEASGGERVSLSVASFNNGAGGAAIDIACRDFRISDVIIRSHGETAITVQPEAGDATLDNPNGLISNVTIEDCVRGIQVVMNDVADDAHVTLSNCRVLRATDRGYLFQKSGSVNVPSGQIWMNNCVAFECTNQGVHALHCKLNISGGDFSNNGDDGIKLQPQDLFSRDAGIYHIVGAKCTNNTKFGIECVYYAANDPRIQIAAYCDGNAAGLLSVEKDTQIYVPYPAATDLQIQNLRKHRYVAAGAIVTLSVGGETSLRVSGTGLVRLQDGTNGQILTVTAIDSATWLYDLTQPESAGQGVTQNLSLWDSVNQVMQVNNSITLQYRASTAQWYQIGASTPRKKQDLTQTIAADDNAIYFGISGDTADTAYPFKAQGSRGNIAYQTRNTRASGSVWEYFWTNAGDAYQSYHDGTNNFVAGLDNSAAQWKVSASGTLGTTDAIAVDGSATATHTRFFLYDVDKAAMQRVLVGAADSGGTGYKMLRVVN